MFTHVFIDYRLQAVYLLRKLRPAAMAGWVRADYIAVGSERGRNDVPLPTPLPGGAFDLNHGTLVPLGR